MTSQREIIRGSIVHPCLVCFRSTVRTIYQGGHRSDMNYLIRNNNSKCHCTIVWAHIQLFQLEDCLGRISNDFIMKNGEAIPRLCHYCVHYQAKCLLLEIYTVNKSLKHSVHEWNELANWPVQLKYKGFCHSQYYLTSINLLLNNTTTGVSRHCTLHTKHFV